MKNTVSKRLIAAALVLVLALSMIIPAMAASDVDYTITIAPGPGSATGDTYTDRFQAYQIFSGEPYFGTTEPTGAQNPPASAQLADVKWGTGINAESFAAALLSASEEEGNTLYGVFADLDKYSDKYNSDDCAQAVANDLTGEKTAAQISAFAKLAKANKKDVPATSEWKDNNWQIKVKGGYYLIVDTLNNKDVYDSTSSYILGVFGNETIKMKSSLPEVDKKIVTDAENTANGTTSEVGDKVTFRLTATLPENYAEYSSYKLVFNDTMSAGLTYVEGSLKMYAVNGSTKAGITNGYSAVEENGSLTVTVEDVKSVASSSTITIDKDTQIVVEYAATLNTAAVAGTPQTNEVYLVYSNDPNSDGTGTDKNEETTDKKVYVHDFALDITKVGDNNVKLRAGFAVMNSKGEYGLFTLADGKYTLAGWIAAEALGNISDWTAAVENPKDFAEGSYYVGFMTAENSGELKLSGFAAGTYTLKEVVTPDSYNTIEPIDIKITATLDESGALKEVKAENTNNVSGVDVNEYAEGSIPVTVLNVSASALPGTGGIGITVFYTIGIILLACAGIMLVRKKRVQ